MVVSGFGSVAGAAKQLQIRAEVFLPVKADFRMEWHVMVLGASRNDAVHLQPLGHPTHKTKPA